MSEEKIIFYLRCENCNTYYDIEMNKIPSPYYGVGNLLNGCKGCNFTKIKGFEGIYENGYCKDKAEDIQNNVMMGMCGINT